MKKSVEKIYEGIFLDANLKLQEIISVLLDGNQAKIIDSDFENLKKFEFNYFLSKNQTLNMLLKNNYKEKKKDNFKKNIFMLLNIEKIFHNYELIYEKNFRLDINNNIKIDKKIKNNLTLYFQKQIFNMKAKKKFKNKEYHDEVEKIGVKRNTVKYYTKIENNETKFFFK